MPMTSEITPEKLLEVYRSMSLMRRMEIASD